METLAKDLALLQLIPREKVDQLVTKWRIDKNVKSLKAFKLTEVLLASTIFERKCVRDVESSFGIPKSTFADSLARRPIGFFEDLFSLVLAELLRACTNRRDRAELRDIIALDSSVCQVHGSLHTEKSWKAGKELAALKFHAAWNVNEQYIADFRITGHRRSDLTIGKMFEIQKGKIYVFDRAYIDLTLWLKVTQGGADFVMRLKKMGNRLHYIHKSLGEGINHTGVLHDGIWQPGEYACYKLKLKFKDIKFRHIVYRDPDSGKLFDFVTSDFVMPAQKVADIYRKRWAVELLFRWLKGHLNIRRFSMKNKNAINIQLIIASILQLLLRLKRETEKLACTDWELLRKLRTAIERYFYETRLGTALRDLGPLKPTAATSSVEPEP